MARLKAAKRNKLPKSDFGIPSERKYPMPDKSHARNAKARASEMENRGAISKSTQQKIDRKADAKLGSSQKQFDKDHKKLSDHGVKSIGKAWKG